MPPQKNVPKSVLRHLADLASVPRRKRAFYYNEVHAIVRDAWQREALKIDEKAGKQMLKSVLSIRENVSALSAGDAKILQDVLVSPEGRLIFPDLAAEGLITLKNVLDQLARLVSLLTGSALNSPAPPNRKRGRAPGGRRLGSIKDPLLQEFVFQLWLSTGVAGGKFSFAKDPPRGTLVDALEKLKPYVPTGFMPNVWPGPTLQKIRDHLLRAHNESVQVEAELTPEPSKKLKR
jgi:hypothetical protein